MDLNPNTSDLLSDLTLIWLQLLTTIAIQTPMEIRLDIDSRFSAVALHSKLVVAVIMSLAASENRQFSAFTIPTIHSDLVIEITINFVCITKPAPQKNRTHYGYCESDKFTYSGIAVVLSLFLVQRACWLIVVSWVHCCSIFLFCFRFSVVWASYAVSSCIWL